MTANKSTKTKNVSRKLKPGSQTRKIQSRGPQRGAKKKVKEKQDNTKLFIGLCAAALFLAFIIIAAASGGNNTKTTNPGELSADFLTAVQKQEIYKRYNEDYDALEDQASYNMSKLSMEDQRTIGKKIQSKKRRIQSNLPNKMLELYRNKFKGITLKYIQKHVIDAGDAGKF